MVNSVTSFSRNGLRDWFLQRVTAGLLLAFLVLLSVFLATHQPLSHESFQRFFSNPIVKISTVLALLSVVIHAWIGMWTVYTDYLKCACLRGVVQVGTIILLIALLLWGILIVWS